MKYGIIYKITNTINNKIYIGQTIKENPYIRIRCHFKKQRSIDLVYRSFLKYGKDVFKIELLSSATSKENLNFLEKHFIQYYNSKVPNGFNIKTGGDAGGSLPLESRKKMSEARKGKSSPVKGIPKTKEHRENMSKSRKGFTSENRKRAALIRAEKCKRKIIAINIKTKEEIVFSSITECAEKLNLVGTCISRVCRGGQKRTQHKGWQFRYLDPKENETPLQLKDTTYRGITNVNRKYLVTLKGKYYGSFPTLEIALNIKQLVQNDPNNLNTYLKKLQQDKIITVWSERKII